MPWNASKWLFLCIYLFPKTPTSSRVGTCSKDVLKREGFNHMERWREERRWLRQGKWSALRSLLTQALSHPSQSGRVQEGNFARLQSQGWERMGGAEKCPKGSDSRGVQGKACWPCVEGQHTAKCWGLG